MSDEKEPFRGGKSDLAGSGEDGCRSGAGRAADREPGLSAAALWRSQIEGANCASLLVVIGARIGPALRGQLQPEDILQESLLQAWRDRGRAQFQSARAFRSWLLTIIDHRIRDAAERAATLKRGGAGGVAAPTGLKPLEVEPSGSTTPSRVAAYREHAAVMAVALQEVPPESREVVHLRLFHQFTLQQISEQLGLSLAVVRARLRRGAEVYRQRLRAGGIGRSTLCSTGLSARDGTDPAS